MNVDVEPTGDLGITARQKTGKMQTVKARALRYFDAAVAVSLIGAACYLLGLWFGVKIIGDVQTTCLYIALVVLLTAVLSTRIFRLVLRFKTLRYVAAYPSVSVVSAIVLTCAVLYVPILKHYRQAIISAAGILFGAVAVREIWIWIRGVLSYSKTPIESAPIGWPNELRWLLEEKPVAAVRDDRFGCSALVHRLASMVEENSCQSFGLTGPHGSGKTSVLKMVEGELRKRSNKHWFVFVGGWGRADENVSASVLEAIVDRLHEEGVEALSLLTWPADYMREILGDSSFLTRTIRCCVQDQQNSVTVLQRLDPVLDAIAKRVVVVVEDVDRNTSGNGMDTLCHLLDDFRQTRNVSFFFLKSEETKTGIDFHRLCEHTEMMPRLVPDVLAELLDQAMCAAKTAASGKLLLQADRLDVKRLVVRRQVGENILDGNVVWSALCTLAHTPRSLKHALRRTMRVWQELAGEVDLLELLFWSLLREGCPKGYDYLRKNIQELRQMPSGFGGDEKKKEPLKRVREQIASLELSSAHEQALKLVLSLFGLNVSILNDESFFLGMASDSAFGEKGLPAASQSISMGEPTDYFIRLEAGTLGDQEISDQQVLREMQRYVQDRTRVLPARAAEFKLWAEKIVQFEGLLPTDRLLDLIEDHIEALGVKLKGRARDSSPGFQELLDLWRKRGEAHEKLGGRLETFLVKAIDYSLELAHGVYYWYVSRRDSDAKSRIRNRWIEELRRRVECRVDYLSGSMDAENPLSLFHTMRFRDEYPAYNTAQDWQWLVPYLIEALARHPEETTPDIAHLFIRDMRGARAGEGAWFELDSEYFEGMCPAAEDRAALARGLLQYTESHSENDPTAFMIQYVKEDLLRYCSDEKRNCSDREVRERELAAINSRTLSRDHREIRG